MPSGDNRGESIRGSRPYRSAGNGASAIAVEATRGDKAINVKTDAMTCRNPRPMCISPHPNGLSPIAAGTACHAARKNATIPMDDHASRDGTR